MTGCAQCVHGPACPGRSGCPGPGEAAALVARIGAAGRDAKPVHGTAGPRAAAAPTADAKPVHGARRRETGAEHAAALAAARTRTRTPGPDPLSAPRTAQDTGPGPLTPGTPWHATMGPHARPDEPDRAAASYRAARDAGRLVDVGPLVDMPPHALPPLHAFTDAIERDKTALRAAGLPVPPTTPRGGIRYGAPACTCWHCPADCPACPQCGPDGAGSPFPRDASELHPDGAAVGELRARILADTRTRTGDAYTRTVLGAPDAPPTPLAGLLGTVGAPPADGAQDGALDGAQDGPAERPAVSLPAAAWDRIRTAQRDRSDAAQDAAAGMRSVRAHPAQDGAQTDAQTGAQDGPGTHPCPLADGAPCSLTPGGPGCCQPAAGLRAELAAARAELDQDGPPCTCLQPVDLHGPGCPTRDGDQPTPHVCQVCDTPLREHAAPCPVPVPYERPRITLGAARLHVAPLGTPPPWEAPEPCPMAPYADPGPDDAALGLPWRDVGTVAPESARFDDLPPALADLTRWHATDRAHTHTQAARRRRLDLWRDLRQRARLRRATRPLPPTLEP